MRTKTILILGKLPPPYMGPSIATEIILKSTLKDFFNLVHQDTRINKNISEIGKFDILKIFRNLWIYFQLIKKIIKHKPDLVLIPISQSTVAFLKDALYILISKLFFRRVLLHLRGSNFKSWLDQSSILLRWLIVFILKRASGVIVQGNNLRYIYSEYYKKEKIFVVPNGGNFSIPERQESYDNSIQLLYLANLLASKGVEDVIDACIFLKSKIQYHLTLIGEWQDKDVKNRCLQKIYNNQLSVTIYPPKGGEEKFKELSKADIFIFPPREPEGHPWVIVEAMAAGLPVISTNQGAITESVIDGVNGFIVDIQHPDQIADKILFFYNNPALRDKIGKESRKRYEEKFTEEKMVENLVNVFNNLINK